MFFKTYWLLGQNARNLNYIKNYNTKIAKKLADSKLNTKEFLSANSVATPETIMTINNENTIDDSLFDKLIPPFVVKPNWGFWGKWILIFTKISSSLDYITNDWQVFTKKELLSHFRAILDWFYSLSWNRDKVLIEKKIELDEEIELLWKYWLPDIRIIVFNMVPVMAMLRVPTEISNWKANIHAWACWVWIDIWTWKLTYITSYSKIIKSIPGVWDVRWLKLPDWDKALALAVKSQQVTKIWYIWCDIVLDKVLWPLVLELNIRPWLEVQMANLSPLKNRLRKVEGIFINSVEKWVRLWRDLFSWDIEEKIKNISWKKVLWAREYLHILYKEKKYKYLTDIKPSNNKNYIDKAFAKNVLKMSDEDIEKWIIRFDTLLLWENKISKFIIKDLQNVNLILWLSSLKGFLIDPFKYKKWELPVWDLIESFKGKNIAIKKNYEELVKNIDDEIISIDKKLLILKTITPNNIASEKKKFIESWWKHIPELKYNDLKIDLDSLTSEIWKIEISDIPLASIYKRKIDEIKNKISFLKAFKNNDVNWITNYSLKLYWEINPDNLKYANDILSNKEKIKTEEEYLSFDEIKNFIQKFNHIYNINLTLKRWQKTARFVLSWDIIYIRDWAKVWKKELRSIVAHEVEWHYLRKVNGRKINYSIFSNWTAWYLEIDEWIAIYNQNRFLWKTDKKFYNIFESYYLLDYALNNSYSNLLEKTKEYYSGDLERVFNYILRLKRWMNSFSNEWIFCKDTVYLNWYLKVENFINSGWRLEQLYIWKISLDDLEEIKNSYFITFSFSGLITPFFIKN
jgi:alpha-L-glutamate ligase-like protein